MKIIVKTIIISIALVLITTNINANSNKNELNFEYGQFTIPQGAYLFGGVLGVAFSLGHFSFENTVVTGSFNFGYNRNVTDWFGYGGVIPAFQLSPVCMEFGGDKYKGIFEIGVGTQGIAILGIKQIF